VSQLEDGPQPRGRCSKDSSTSTCRYRGANPSSCRYQWLKQGWKLSVATPWCNDSCRNSRTAPDSTRCSCGVCCGVQPRGVTTRVATRGRPAACSELACCGRPPPRVVIVVPTPPRVTVVVPTPPRVAIVVPTPWCNDSRCNSRTHASEQLQLDER